MEKKEIGVLFVCMGNICRSPAGEGIFKKLIKEVPDFPIHVESCGIGDWHIGQPPDRNMQETSRNRGIILTGKAQQIQKKFLDQFDYILAADKEVLKYLYHFAVTPEHKAKISLMTAYSSIYKGEEVPDPYFKSDTAFELVMDILEDACKGLFQHIRHQHFSSY